MQKALFLDRDGIINIDHGYVSRIEDFEFVTGIFPFIQLFIDAGYLVFIVTNQSGIGRGYYSEKNFTQLSAWMLNEFEKQNIHIENVYYCPHSPEEKCYCRKPQAGMIQEALKTYDINLSDSWMVGDKSSDIELAFNAGIKNSIFISSKTNHLATYSFHTIEEAHQYFTAYPL